MEVGCQSLERMSHKLATVSHNMIKILKIAFFAKLFLVLVFGFVSTKFSFYLSQMQLLWKLSLLS